MNKVIPIPEWILPFRRTRWGFDTKGQPYKEGAVYCITDATRNVIVGRYIGKNQHGDYRVQVMARSLSKIDPAPEDEIVCIGYECRVEMVN